jgi:hypothetical protein
MTEYNPMLLLLLNATASVIVSPNAAAGIDRLAAATSADALTRFMPLPFIGMQNTIAH